MFQDFSRVLQALYSPEGQESCDYLAKNNSVRATFWKYGAMCERMWYEKTQKLLETVA